MNRKTEAVFRGWVGLSEQERAELNEEIRKFGQSTEVRKREIRESLQKVYLGPISDTGCPCCGR